MLVDLKCGYIIFLKMAQLFCLYHTLTVMIYNEWR